MGAGAANADAGSFYVGVLWDTPYVIMIPSEGAFVAVNKSGQKNFLSGTVNFRK